MTHVGAGRTRQSYVPVIAKHFIAGRASGEYGFSNSPHNCDLACLASQPIEHMRGEQIVGIMDRNLVRGRWLILRCTRRLPGAAPRHRPHRVRANAPGLTAIANVWVASVAEVAAHLRRVQGENP